MADVAMDPVIDLNQLMIALGEAPIQANPVNMPRNMLLVIAGLLGGRGAAAPHVKRPQQSTRTKLVSSALKLPPIEKCTKSTFGNDEVVQFKECTNTKVTVNVHVYRPEDGEFPMSPVVEIIAPDSFVKLATKTSKNFTRNRISCS